MHVSPGISHCITCYRCYTSVHRPRPKEKIIFSVILWVIRLQNIRLTPTRNNVVFYWFFLGDDGTTENISNPTLVKQFLYFEFPARVYHHLSS